MKTCCCDDHLPYTVVRTSLGVPEVPGLNPGGGIFVSFYSSLGQLASLIFFTVGGAWVWLFWVYVYTIGVISRQFFYSA